MTMSFKVAFAKNFDLIDYIFMWFEFYSGFYLFISSDSWILLVTFNRKFTEKVLVLGCLMQQF